MTTSLVPLSPLTVSGIHELLSFCESAVAQDVLQGRHESEVWRDLFNTRVENLREASAVWHKFEYVRDEGERFGNYVRTSA